MNETIYSGQNVREGKPVNLDQVIKQMQAQQVGAEPVKQSQLDVALAELDAALSDCLGIGKVLSKRLQPVLLPNAAREQDSKTAAACVAPARSPLVDRIYAQVRRVNAIRQGIENDLNSLEI
ncbi:MAG: hypothetical protein V4772_08565 [Pseudomonadota bacterium]